MITVSYNKWYEWFTEKIRMIHTLNTQNTIRLVRVFALSKNYENINRTRRSVGSAVFLDILPVKKISSYWHAPRKRLQENVFFSLFFFFKTHTMKFVFLSYARERSVLVPRRNNHRQINSIKACSRHTRKVILNGTNFKLFRDKNNVGVADTSRPRPGSRSFRGDFETRLV